MPPRHPVLEEFRGVLVRTGKFRPADLETEPPPDLVLGSVAELVR